MTGPKVYTAIGLMSGTSLDGVDAALIRTDGHGHSERLAFVSIPYDDEIRARLRACLGKRDDPDGAVAIATTELTRAHAAAVDWLLSRAGLAPREVDIIGFHGQTLHHEPAQKFTWQIGNGSMLARLTGIDVINDFRSADVAAGGQGAPLLPLYHRALARQAGLDLPVAILNLGGVGNVTYIAGDDAMLAFDTGPGNALIDDWIKKHTGRDYDENGMWARQGTVDETVLAQWLAHPYFSVKPPKSLDRDAWDLSALARLSPADGAATLTAFTVQAAARALEHLPDAPRAWYVTGGGRHNGLIMESLQRRVNAPVENVDTLGWNGDGMEAEGFAYLAVRSLLDLPLSLPGTTGVPRPLTGGRRYGHRESA
jgi:anhydro-N-acetylmuramic acid kinase